MTLINKISELYVIYDSNEGVIADSCTYEKKEAAENVAKFIRKDALNLFKKPSPDLPSVLETIFKVISLEEAIENIKTKALESGLWMDKPGAEY